MWLWTTCLIRNLKSCEDLGKMQLTSSFGPGFFWSEVNQPTSRKMMPVTGTRSSCADVFLWTGDCMALLKSSQPRYDGRRSANILAVWSSIYVDMYKVTREDHRLKPCGHWGFSGKYLPFEQRSPVVHVNK